MRQKLRQLLCKLFNLVTFEEWLEQAIRSSELLEEKINLEIELDILKAKSACQPTCAKRKKH